MTFRENKTGGKVQLVTIVFQKKKKFYLYNYKEANLPGYR